MPRDKSAAIRALPVFLDLTCWFLPHGNAGCAEGTADTVILLLLDEYYYSAVQNEKKRQEHLTTEKNKTTDSVTFWTVWDHYQDASRQ